MTKPIINLLLEGTYPFVRGGVSSWVDQLIRGLADRYDFALTFIGSSPQDHPEQQYTLPNNVISLDCFYLFSPQEDRQTVFSRTNTNTTHHKEKPACKQQRYAWHPLTSVHRRLAKHPSKTGRHWYTNVIKHLQNPEHPMSHALLSGFMANNGPIQHPYYPHDLHKLYFSHTHEMYDQTLWHLLIHDYNQMCPEEPFNHFFWHYRGLYQTIFRLAAIAQHLRPADIYHSLSTGYAGFLGAILAAAGSRPLIITEHGIYTRERRIDLNDAPWLKPPRSTHNVFYREKEPVIRTLWIHFFEQLSRTAYHHATQITTLFSANRQLQIREGAPPEKTQIICNGIDYEQFTRRSTVKPAITTQAPPRIAFIGRVVSIKDVTTFIKAISLVRVSHPNIQAQIIGSLDEQPEYVEHCKRLVNLLNLTQHVHFMGNLTILSLLPTFDILVLTSISEAQPLVILEAMACGVPVVTTDVGACREMINGFNSAAPEPCGIIVPIASAQETAKAIDTLLHNSTLREKLGRVGQKRVKAHYSESTMLSAYHKLYHGVLNTNTSAALPSSPQNAQPGTTTCPDSIPWVSSRSRVKFAAKNTFSITH